VSKGQPVIIVKKKVHGHHAHHGGAWKVAYADFVTAMMAFFLVMWLVGQSPNVKAAVAGYFRDPGVFDTTRGGGVLPGGTEGLKETGVTPAPLDSVNAAREVLERAAENLRQALAKVPAFKALEDRIQITVTAEGLRIELLENAKSSFFAVGSSQLLPETVELLGLIATELWRSRGTPTASPTRPPTGIRTGSCRPTAPTRPGVRWSRTAFARARSTPSAASRTRGHAIRTSRSIRATGVSRSWSRAVPEPLSSHRQAS
jgi:hypothetical protein